MDATQAASLDAEGKVVAVSGEALIQGAAIAQQGEVAGNMEMMVMDALDPALLQMKTEVLEGSSTVTVGGDEGQIITLQVQTTGQVNVALSVSSSVLIKLEMFFFFTQVVNMEEQTGAALGLGQLQLVQVPVTTATVEGLQATYVDGSTANKDTEPVICHTLPLPEGFQV